MKTFSKISLLILSTTIIANIASAQPMRADRVLTDLTTAQATQIKQLGHISENDSINPVYDAKLERTLTPEQNAKYLSLKYGKPNSFKTTDFNFNMDSK